jgi:outer membrane protein assembly factor BamB
MPSSPHVRRWLPAAATALLLAGGLFVNLRSARSPEAPGQARAAGKNKKTSHDWPMFGGSLQRNMVNTVDKDIPTDWSVEKGSEKNIKWSVPLGSRSYAGPVISGGKAIVGTNRAAKRTPPIPGDKGVLRCLREKDGKLLWQSVHDKLAAGLVNDWPDQGICSTPFVDGNRVYYVSNRCELICADTQGLRKGKNLGVRDEKYKDSADNTDADIVWRLDMMKQLGVFPHNLATSSPLVVANLVFVVTSNGVDEGHINVPAPKAPSFIAVNKKTGKVVWSTNVPSRKILETSGEKASLQLLADRGQKILHGQWSNPVYAVVKGKPQIIFPGGDGWLRAYRPSKKKNWKLIWKFDCNPKQSIWKLQGKGTRNNIVATPVVHDNKIYVGVGQDPEHKYGVGHLWCIDITKEDDISPELVVKYVVPKKPDQNDPDYKTKLAKYEKQMEENPTGAVTKKNPNSGLVWHFGGVIGKKPNQKIIFGRTISTCAVKGGLVYAAELKGYLHCLDAKDGKLYWQHNLEAETWSSPSWIDGKIYIGNDDGQLYIFRHGKKKQEPKIIEMEHRVRATPVAANGVLYVMTENRLYAIKK